MSKTDISKGKIDLWAIAAGVAFGVIWASAFTSARVVVAHAPPLTALAVRFLLSGIIGVALARAMGQSWRLTRPQWRATFVFGICQNMLYLGLTFLALRTVEASLAAIIASSMPFLAGIAGWLIFRERVALMGWIGLTLGFVGVAVIMGARLSGGTDPIGVLLCIGGVLALTAATLSVRGASSGGNYLMIVGLQMLIGSMGLFVVALPLETWAVDWTWSFIVAFLYTAIFPGLVATSIWVWLVNRIGTVRAAVFHFLTPFFGVAIARVILGEPMGLQDAIGVAVITLGILAVQLSKQKPTAT